MGNFYRKLSDLKFELIVSSCHGYTEISYLQQQSMWLQIWQGRVPGRHKQPALGKMRSMEPALGCNYNCSFGMKVDKLRMLVQCKAQMP